MTARPMTADRSIELLELELEGERLIVVSLPIERPAASAGALTPAERDVARDVMRGLSNAAIARRRGSSPRTVANQLAAVYRKLGVASRAELASKLTGDGKP